MSLDLSCHQRKNSQHNVNDYFYDEPYLFSFCAYNFIRICVPEVEVISILEAFHSSPMGDIMVWCIHDIENIAIQVLFSYNPLRCARVCKSM